MPGLESGFARAMHVHDDGSGPALFLVGSFTVAGLSGTQRVVRWNGSIATAVDTGLPANVSFGSLAVFDAGTGPMLYAGVPSTAGGVYVWNGSRWTTTAPHLAARRIYALATYTDANGPALYAAGEIDVHGGTTFNNVARYDGTSWTPLGVGITPSGVGFALTVHDDGSGARLYLAGQFTRAGGLLADGLASWDGAAWHPITNGPNLNYARSLVSFDDGSGPGLHVGGYFQRVGRVAATKAAVLRNGEWERLAGGEGMGAEVHALHEFDDGTGKALYAGGAFETAGTRVARSVARWDGAAWSALGAPNDGDGEVRVLGDYDAGSGARLVAGGEFSRIGGIDAANLAEWNGAIWSPIGGGVTHTGGLTFVEAITVFDSGAGPELVAGGRFTHAGGVAASNVARWNGTSWSPLGSGTNSTVEDLIVHDDGSGPALYTCGWFSSAGGVAVARVARWDGSAWSAVGSLALYGGFSQMSDLEIYDEGSGPRLHMCGSVTGTAGFGSVVRWDGVAWSSVGAPLSGRGVSMTTFHDGVESLLVVGSFLSNPDHAPVRAWNGQSWVVKGLCEGPASEVRALAVHDVDADGVPDLYVGGLFENVDGAPSANLAVFRSCGTVGTVQCAGDGSGASCPCANFGASGRGCANSAVADGARLACVGIASLAADALTLEADGMTGTTALFFQGTSSSAVPFDDGLQCASGTLVRLRNAAVVGGEARFPSSGDASLSTSGLIQGPGEARTYQVLYRNAASFCTPGSTNFTNGLRVVWGL